MDLAKQIDYWNIGSDEDMSAAYALFEKEKYRHALFFAHLAVEKQLKAHVTLRTRAMPPKIHNLSRLAELTALSLQPNQMAWLRTFNLYQLEGRYPDMGQINVDRAAAEERLTKAKEFIQWLKTQLWK